MKWIIILPYQNRKMSYTNNFENLEKISDTKLMSTGFEQILLIKITNKSFIYNMSKNRVRILRVIEILINSRNV